MIWESAPWKEQLLRDAGKLRKFAQTKLKIDDCERQLVQFERLVFMTAYSMRRLWEAEKLSTDWNTKHLSCVRFPLKGQIPDMMNWHNFDKYYDLDRKAEVRLKPEEYCDRIIHSFIFSPVVSDDRTIEYFYFTSDRMRKHAIWMIGVSKVYDLIRATGKDYPSTLHRIRDEDDQWITWSGHGDPPAGWMKAAMAKRKGR